VSGDFRLESWLVKPSLNVISAKSTTIRLEPKVMEVLVCLARHAGEALSKENLVQAVWPDTFVSDDALKRCISELRRVFEDDAREPRIIQTIPKRGYRLMVPVNGLTGDVRIDAAASLAHNSIAVLPFINMSPDPENEFFADGITEEIINALAQIKNLHIVARSSAFSFKGKHMDPRVVGEQLNVRTVLEGSVRKAGDHLRITAQLINTANGYHMWSERYDREMKDIFAIQDDIASSIAQRLTVTFERSGQEFLVRAGTRNVEAYRLYLKRRYYWNKWSEEGFNKGLTYFRKAVELDPTYTLAYCGLADSYGLMVVNSFLPQSVAMPKVKKAAMRALQLHPELAEPHVSWAIHLWFQDWQLAEAEKEWKQALELNPNYVTAYHGYEECLTIMRRHDEAIAIVRRSLEIDPFSLILNTAFGWALYFARRYEHAIEQLHKTVDLDANYPLTHLILCLAHRERQQFAEAISEGQKAVDLTGGAPWMRTALGCAYAVAGDRDSAVQQLSLLTEYATHKYVNPYFFAQIYFALGDLDTAWPWLQNAYTERSFWLLYLNSEPGHERWREDPRVENLLRDMGIEQPPDIR